MVRQKTCRRLVKWGRPVTRIDSSEFDDVEARFFDEVQAEIAAGYPPEIDLGDLHGPWPRRTVANTRSTSPFYRLPEQSDIPVKRFQVKVTQPKPVKVKVGPKVCLDCNTVHSGGCW